MSQRVPKRHQIFGVQHPRPFPSGLKHRLDAMLHAGKRPRILPSAPAMGWMKNMIDRGKFPGAKAGDFYPLLFNDQVHPANGLGHDHANGAYVVDAT